MRTLDRGDHAGEAGRIGAGRIDLAQTPSFTVGGLRVSPSTRTISARGRQEIIEPRVLQVLIALWRADGATVSRDALIQSCWDGRIVNEHALNASITKLRRISEAWGAFEVETIPRVGYLLKVTGLEAGEVSRRVPRRSLPWLLWAAAGLLAIAVPAIWLMTRAGTAAHVVARPPLSLFRDCADVCPEMVVLPPGRFTMGMPGATPSGDENAHVVDIRYALAVSRHDVTREQYQRFVDETGRTDVGGCFTVTSGGKVLESNGSWKDPGFAQTPNDPAVCINWADVRDYAKWLSERTGQRYRLLSEAEWEYAATSGGRDRPAPPADASACKALNAADQDYSRRFPDDAAVNRSCADGYVFTSPVGAFARNRFGLDDMLGNVWQWTADCYARTPPDATYQGAAWNSPDCVQRVVRGGSWVDTPQKIRASRRVPSGLGERFPMNGFRMARLMP